jgi:hypothetical protein
VIVGLLIGLCESMMIHLTSAIVSKTTEIWLPFVGLFNFYGDSLDLKFKK